MPDHVVRWIQLDSKLFHLAICLESKFQIPHLWTEDDNGYFPECKKEKKKSSLKS